MGNSRRGLAAGVNFIWDLPMTLLLIYRIFIFIDIIRSKDILISKADKGGSCVVMNKIDYITKMEEVLSDSSKFTELGPVSKFDNTHKFKLVI